ncbi:MAG: acetylornithine carbamoyltransferase [Cyclobacteriaceae bacterium]
MKQFLSVKDTSDPADLVRLARDLKRDPFQFENLGKRKTIGLIFLNPSLRTRMSMIKAAQLVGLNVIALNLNQEGWKIETEDGVIMDGDNAEHINEAIPVISSYCDLLAIRSFPTLTDREYDYSEALLIKIQRLSSVPVINMESATVHPLQSLTDLVTIDELKKVERPKIVLSWAPHPRSLPQAVANSFLEWTLSHGHDITVVQPKGLELAKEFTGNAAVSYNQKEALSEADFVYVKNWSSYNEYGSIHRDPEWIISREKMRVTNEAKLMHCLPVRRNVVISEEILESPQSVVVLQAGNRVCAAQAVLVSLLKENG